MDGFMQVEIRVLISITGQYLPNHRIGIQNKINLDSKKNAYVDKNYSTIVGSIIIGKTK
jgi:hypothetical protein